MSGGGEAVVDTKQLLVHLVDVDDEAPAGNAEGPPVGLTPLDEAVVMSAPQGSTPRGSYAPSRARRRVGPAAGDPAGFEGGHGDDGATPRPPVVCWPQRVAACPFAPWTSPPWG